MTPSSTDKTALTIKQQRAARREKKLDKHRQLEKSRIRNRRIAWIIGIVAAGSAATVVIAGIVIKPPRADYTAGAEGATIEGVEEFDNTGSHVETPVDYAQSPPAGGSHSATWLNCGVYTESVPDENAVHSLEHGAIWVTYDESVGNSDLDVLRSMLPSTHVVLSPADSLSAPVVLTGWNRQLRVDSTTDPRIPAFLEEFWKSKNAPEPGASCAGGVDGPGKIT